MRGLPALLACASLATAVQARRPVREFRIDLDLPPEQRWSQLIRESNADGVAFNDTVWGFWNQYFANDKLVTDALYGCAPGLCRRRCPRPADVPLRAATG